MNLFRDPAVESDASQRHDNPDVTFIEVVNLSSRKHEYVAEWEDRPKRSFELVFHITSVELEDSTDDADEDSDLTD